MQALRAYMLGGLFVATTAYPGWLPPGQDGYPLSTYPMFSRDRGREAAVAGVFALDADRDRLPLGPRYIANSEAMQAVRTLNTTLNRGRRAARKLCRTIARRVASSDDPALQGAVHVELSRQRVDSVAYLAGREAVRGRRVHARCRVRRQETP